MDYEAGTQSKRARQGLLMRTKFKLSNGTSSPLDSLQSATQPPEELNLDEVPRWRVREGRYANVTAVLRYSYVSVVAAYMYIIVQ